MLQHADAVRAGARLPHNQVVQGGQHRRRLLRRKVATLQKKNYYFYKKSNLFMHRLDIYMFVMCHTQNLKSWNRRTLEDFIKFLRPSEEAAVEEEVKPSGDGEKVKKIELWL